MHPKYRKYLSFHGKYTETIYVCRTMTSYYSYPRLGTNYWKMNALNAPHSLYYEWLFVLFQHRSLSNTPGWLSTTQRVYPPYPEAVSSNRNRRTYHAMVIINMEIAVLSADIIQIHKLYFLTFQIRQPTSKSE
jgi:hypothetical protein